MHSSNGAPHGGSLRADFRGRQTGVLSIAVGLLVQGCTWNVAPRAPVAYAPAVQTPAIATAPLSTQAAPDSCTVVLYGDSILNGGYGGNHRLPEPPAATLRRLRPRYLVKDRTAAGETATARSSTFSTEQRSSHYVVIAHGINDAAQGLAVGPPLRRMVQQAQREGRDVILTGLSRTVVQVPGRASADSDIRLLAKETGAAFVDWDAVSWRAGDMADPIHPGKPYSDRLVERIVQVLDQRAPQCR